MKYVLILLDLDDTLIDNLENVRYAFKKMLDYLSLPYSEEEFVRWYKFDKQFWLDFYNGKISVPYEKSDERFVPYVQSKRYYDFFNHSFDMDVALEINKIFIPALKEQIVPIDGVYETLEYLSSKYTLVVATNGPREAVVSKLTKINCYDFISNVFSADMTKECVTKPNPEFFNELLDYLEYYDRDKILIVGDSLHSEVRGGIESGIDSCWFDRGNEIVDEYKPTMIIKKLTDLKTLI